MAQIIVNVNVVLVKIIIIVGLQDDKDLVKLTRVISVVDSTHIFFTSNYF